MRAKTIQPLRVALSAFVAAAIFLPFNLLADSSTAFYQDDTTKRVELHGTVLQLKALWEAGDLERMEVIHISTNRVYRKSVSTSTIDATFFFKLIVREPKDSKSSKVIFQRGDAPTHFSPLAEFSLDTCAQKRSSRIHRPEIGCLRPSATFENLSA